MSTNKLTHRDNRQIGQPSDSTRISRLGYDWWVGSLNGLVKRESHQFVSRHATSFTGVDYLYDARTCVRRGRYHGKSFASTNIRPYSAAKFRKKG